MPTPSRSNTGRTARSLLLASASGLALTVFALSGCGGEADPNQADDQGGENQAGANQADANQTGANQADGAANTTGDDSGAPGLPRSTQTIGGDGLAEGLATSDDAAVTDALQVGEVVPDFELVAHTGREVRLSSALAEGPVVVVFFRGDWCFYCKQQLEQIQASLSEIEAAGATVVAVSPQDRETSRGLAQSLNLAMPILSDADARVSADFGVGYRVGGRFPWLPLGATYVIDHEGVVRRAFLQADYRQRATPADIITAINEA